MSHNQINYIEMNPLEAKFRTSSLRSWETHQADAHKLAQLAPTLKAMETLPMYESSSLSCESVHVFI